MRNPQKDYRAFRGQIVDKQSDRSPVYDGLPSYVVPPGGAFRIGREKIRHFRSHLAFHADDILRETPDLGFAVRRGLRIPYHLSLQPGSWSRAWQVVTCLLPTSIVLRRARALLDQVGTLEGRRYVFERHVILAPFGHFSYYEALDFVIRRLAPCRSFDEFRGVERLIIEWLKAAHVLGVTEPAAILKIHGEKRELDGICILLFVEEGVVRAPDELAWVTRGQREHFFHAEDQCIPSARELIRTLMSYGVSRQWIAGIFRFSQYRYDSDRLSENLGTLAEYGADLTEVLDAVGDQVWLCENERWKFLLDVIGATSADDVRRFKEFLGSTQTVQRSFVDALRALGADIAELAECQTVMLSAASENGPSSSDLALLIGPPYSLSLSQVAQCSSYMDGKRDLEGFLATLARFGYGDARALMAFQSCYSTVTTAALERTLEIVKGRDRGMPIEVVAKWVQQAARGGHFDAYAHLADRLAIGDLDQLLNRPGFSRHLEALNLRQSGRCHEQPALCG